ncbi:DUF3048 domain-containing protein [Fusibacter bizertensis]
MMTKRNIIIGSSVIGTVILVVILSLIINASKNSDGSKEPPTNHVTVPETLIESTEQATDESTAAVYGDGHYDPLTGLYSENDLTSRRPFVVMLDNQYMARPQAALSEADIVYEILAEGLITRYMAVFYGNYPEHVGPVRSARPYFIEKASEFNPYYVHVGGSMQALSDIRKFQMADIDGLVSGAFWREDHKKIPHNMYTSSDSMLKDATRLGYTSTTPVSFLDFNKSFTIIDGKDASEITFVYKEPVKSDPIGYYTSYKYNDEKHLYYRYTNGEPHVDENTKEQLTCTNILVQYAKTTVLDSDGRLDVDLITSGKGKYYTAGKVMDITWSKESVEATTEFFDIQGNPIKLNPGVTWFQIMKIGKEETIK